MIMIMKDVHLTNENFPLQVKKHIKQGQGHEGGIFSVEAPLHVSNVQVLDPVSGYDFKIFY